MAATDHGLDFSDSSPEVAEVIRSVLPVFTHESERPESVGTCILIRVAGHAFILTAGHVVDAVERTTRRFAVAIGGSLIAVQRDRFVTRQQDSADMGLIPLRPAVADAFQNQGGAFLEGEAIDVIEMADGTDLRNMLANTYFALGFPVSRSHSKVQHVQRKIRLKTYSVRLTLAPTKVYPNGFSNREHILLDYDDREIVREGRSINPPAVRGMSGGGIFRYSQRDPRTVRLVGVLIERRRGVRVLVGTRASVAVALAQEVIERYPEAFR